MTRRRLSENVMKMSTAGSTTLHRIRGGAAKARHDHGMCTRLSLTAPAMPFTKRTVSSAAYW
jgi:hypothetical protein